jgi:hypothetical protein
MSPVTAREDVVSAPLITGRRNSFWAVSSPQRVNDLTIVRSVASLLRIGEGLE